MEEPQSSNEPVAESATQPEAAPKAPARARSHVKKSLNLPVPEELLILAIDDNGSVVPTPGKTILHYGLAAAFLADLVLAKKIQLADDRLTVSNTAPTGDTLFDDILAMIAAEKKPRKLNRWIQALGGKLTTKQVALRLVERKVIVIDKKNYSWVIPFPAFPQGQTSAKYLVKQHVREVVLAGEPASPADITLLSLLKVCRLLRLVFTRDERKSADKKVDALVKDEIFGQAVAALLEEK